MNRTINLLATAATALLLAACMQDTDEKQPGGKNSDVLTDVTITLTPEVPQEVETRMPANTPDLTTIQELIILQYDLNGNLIKKILSADATEKNGTYLVTNADLINQPSKTYVITNEGLEIANASSKEEYLLNALAIRSEDDLFPIQKSIMSGVYIGTPTPKMNIVLKHSAAMLLLIINDNTGQFTLESMQLKQVADVMGIHDGSVALPYPATLGSIDYPVNNTTPLGDAAVYFLPENLRGTGTATSELQKNADTAPAGQAAYCTYAEIKGKYTSNTNWLGALNVTYRIYLGGNNTNDYNLRRNTIYNVSVNIKGANRADTRITTVTPESASAATYMDYTDNFCSWFAIATTDADNSNTMSWNNWVTGTGTGADGSRCPTGWRLPTIEELMMMYVYGSSIRSSGIADSEAYFEAEKSYLTNSESNGMIWTMLEDGRNTGLNYKDGAYYCVRCVRDF